MMKYLLLTATALPLALATPVFAGGSDVDCGNVSGQTLSHAEAESKASALGYDVRRVKSEDGCLEIYAFDENGGRVELFMNPVTGEIVDIENKS